MTESSIIIRLLHPDDAADLHAIITQPEVVTTLVQLPSMEFAETQAWVARQEPGRHRLVAEMGGRVVGSSNLTQSQNPRRMHSASLGLMVHRDYWGQGVGSALLAALLDLADNWFNLWRVELGVFTGNAAALHLYQKFGFEVEARRRDAVFGGDGRFHDEYNMARIRSGAPTAAAVPLPIVERRADVTAVSIRPLHPDDVPDLHALFTHPAVCSTTNQYPSQEIGRIQARVADKRSGLYRYAAVAAHTDGSQKVVGNINLHQKPMPRLAHAGSLGMSVHPAYWGMGIGARLMETILDLADNWLNLRRVELSVTTDNPPAIHLYEKFGFAHEGVQRLYNYGNGRWADVHLMARLKDRRAW